MKPSPSTPALLLLLAALPAIAQAPPLSPAPPPPMAGDAEPPIPEVEQQPLPQAPAAVPAQPPSDALPPARPPAPATFDQALSPHGRWVVTPEYGRVWAPANVAPDWQPYTDGRWVFTASGWSFASTVPWGWAAFHYGRWGFRAGIGWFWVPGTVWGPAWVSWRTSPTHVAWAPLAPAGYVYPRGWYGWVALRAGDMTLAVRHRVVPRAYAVTVLRGARPGWGSAPLALRPEYRLRGYRGRGVQERRRETKGHGKRRRGQE